jgi:hypothetical protein
VTSFGRLVRDIASHGLLGVGDQLVFYQSHHHALFLDQSVSDALGGESWAVRRQAAFEASYALLSSLYGDLGMDTPEKQLALASELFGAMGNGSLTFQIKAEGGTVRGEALLHGAGFVERYGESVRNKRVLDAFTAGYCSAAASLAYPSDWGLLDADENACVGRRDEACEFGLSRRPDRPRFGAALTRGAVEAIPGRIFNDKSRDEGSGGAGGVAARILAGLNADERGVVRAFGVRLSLLPVVYTNQITFDTMHLVEKRTPELFPVFCALVREAAQMGAYHLLGGVLASSEWRDAGGVIAEDPAARLEQLIEVSRALGWGAFFVGEYVPGKVLALRSPITHESAYYAVRHGKSMRGRLAFQQGTALALMHLIHRVDFGAPGAISTAGYNGLFRDGPRYHVEETRSPLRGDDVSEVVVETISE